MFADFDISNPQTLTLVILIPLISALIGWGTNALAVRMIFRPRRPRRILGLRVQGLVPRRQPEIARAIGRAVEHHLLSHHDIKEILAGEDAQAALDDAIRDHLREFIDKRLVEAVPMVQMFLSGDLRDRIENMMLAEVHKLVPELTARTLTRLEERLDFQELVEDRIRNFDTVKLESIILDIASRELRAIELLGGVLGFTIGCVQVLLLALF